MAEQDRETHRARYRGYKIRVFFNGAEYYWMAESSDWGMGATDKFPTQEVAIADAKEEIDLEYTLGEVPGQHPLHPY